MAAAASMTVNENNSFLVIIDIQHRLITAMPDDAAKRMVKQVSTLLQAAQILNLPFSATEQYPKGLGSTVDELQQYFQVTDNIIDKTCFSCVDADGFMSLLRTSHRRQIILTGMEAHICVLQTAFSLQEQGYQVFVVEDAICSRTQQNQDNALQRLRQAGVIVTNTESVLFEWLKNAKHSEFKSVSKLIL